MRIPCEIGSIGGSGRLCWSGDGVSFHTKYAYRIVSYRLILFLLLHWIYVWWIDWVGSGCAAEYLSAFITQGRALHGLSVRCLLVYAIMGGGGVEIRLHW